MRGGCREDRGGCSFFVCLDFVCRASQRSEQALDAAVAPHDTSKGKAVLCNLNGHPLASQTAFLDHVNERSQERLCPLRRHIDELYSDVTADIERSAVGFHQRTCD